MFSLSGRVALVTGGNSGIGLGIATAFAVSGARVAIGGRDRDKNEIARGQLGDDSRSYVLDVRDESSVVTTVTEIVEQFGRIDILVNNAGNYSESKLVDKTLQEWRNVIDTHLTGAFLCGREAGKAMIAAGRGGKIINIGSMYSIFGSLRGGDYAAAKSGLLGLTRTLACELAPNNIQANAILPGWIRTPMTDDMPETERGEQIMRKTPGGRWGEPDDLAGTALFLASAASDFVTGAAIPVDGGYAIAEELV